MGFTLDFLWNLAALAWHLAPLFAGLVAIIAGLSVAVGRREGWPVSDSLYFGFITALTVGYGDLRPKDGWCRLMSIVIAVFGLITTGILIAMAVQAALVTFGQRA